MSVHFVFKNCADIRLEGFNQQNQLSTIEFSVQKQVLPATNVVPTDAVVKIKDHNQFVAEAILAVNFVTEFGVDGGFKCSLGEVASIRACNEDGIPDG
ncbi:MAG TPA: hypothetical protein VN653_12950 [Anaerolineales bacterium]|nr:hypothetical protein [Anaerolineales bacterium]